MRRRCHRNARIAPDGGEYSSLSNIEKRRSIEALLLQSATVTKNYTLALVDKTGSLVNYVVVADNVHELYKVLVFILPGVVVYAHI